MSSGTTAKLSRDGSPRDRVVNYGVPGTSTAQLRKRFVSSLDRFHRRVVVFWAGVNDRHNRADSEGDHRRDLFGDEFVFQKRAGENLPPEEQARVTELDVRWMIDQAQSRGIAFVAITYPFPAPMFTAANEGIIRATDAYGVARAGASEAEERLQAECAAKGEPLPSSYDHTLHPTQLFYDAIGDLVLQRLEEKHYL